jgi:hypothetical protein
MRPSSGRLCLVSKIIRSLPSPFDIEANKIEIHSRTECSAARCPLKPLVLETVCCTAHGCCLLQLRAYERA